MHVCESRLSCVNDGVKLDIKSKHKDQKMVIKRTKRYNRQETDRKDKWQNEIKT
jgi:hypothetical protein